MRCHIADWDPISGSPGRFTGGPLKVVWHKTQGGSLAGARGAYRANRSDPHFTVHEHGIAQHIDTDYAARALRNASGGVQTNFDGPIQVEVVGWSGTTMPNATAANVRRLRAWLRDERGVPEGWPMGRPPQTAQDGYGLNTGHRDSNTWDSVGGHYGHSQVPENTHWDPAWTDEEWALITEEDEDVALTPDELDLLQRTHDKARDAVNYGVAVLAALNELPQTTTIDIDAEAVARRVDELLAARLAS